jgi:hypothetical protein
LEKEKEHFVKKKGINFEEERKEDMLLLEVGTDGGKGAAKQLRPLQADADEEDDTDGDSDDSDSDVSWRCRR